MTVQVTISETFSIEVCDPAAAARRAYWEMTEAERNTLNAQWHEEFKARFREIYPDHNLVEFNDPYSKLDGVVTNKAGKIVAYYEVKCRNYTSTEIKERAGFGKEWIIDKAKLDAGIEHADAARTRFVGFIYCVLDKVLVKVPIFQRNQFGGKVLSPYRVEYRETSDGNRGTFSSSNVAIVSLDNAEFIEPDGGFHETH